MSHQKVFATLIICLALVASVVIYAKKDYFFGQKLAVSSNTTSGSIVSETNLTTQNPINDDWRKTLINISSATNSPIQIITSQSSGANNGDDNTLTSQISKQFFALYLQDKKNGVTIDRNEAMNIANKTLSTLDVTSLAKHYGINDIKISQDVSSTNREKYRQQLIDTVNKNSLEDIFALNGLIIVSSAVQNKNEVALAKLDPIIKNYQSLIKDTLAVIVPRDNIGNHLVYLNTLSSILYEMRGMKQILSDPIIGYLNFSNYQKDSIKLAVVIENMTKYFAQ